MCHTHSRKQLGMGQPREARPPGFYGRWPPTRSALSDSFSCLPRVLSVQYSHSGHHSSGMVVKKHRFKVTCVILRK